MFFSRLPSSTIRSTARTQLRFISQSAAKSEASSTEKASQAASKHLATAAEKAKQLGGPLAAKAESLLGAYSGPIVYNAKVVGSLFKQVYIAEGLAPPTSFQTVTSAYKTLWSRAKDPSYWSKIVENGEWKKLAIYGVEGLGIFTIGEMIGRRSIVGYRLDTPSHGHSGH